MFRPGPLVWVGHGRNVKKIYDCWKSLEIIIWDVAGPSIRLGGLGADPNQETRPKLATPHYNNKKLFSLEVAKCLEPVYEEVFDEVEEMILRDLFVAFKEMRDTDEANNEVQTTQVKRIHKRGAKIMNRYGPRGLFKKSQSQK